MFHENLIFQEFDTKLKHIDLIAQWAIEKKHKKISEKYRSIQSTAKLLKGYVSQFTNKSLKFQQNLRQTNRIQQIQQQTQYHKNRVQECKQLSQNLEVLIQKKNNIIRKIEQKAKIARQELILIKTQNIKKILKIEMLEGCYQAKKQKENRQIRYMDVKKNIQQKQALMKTGLVHQTTVIDNMKKEKYELSRLLWQKINKKIEISKYLASSYESLKENLIRQQKKSNRYGLTGSLLFRLVQNEQNSKKMGLTIGRKNVQDQKLLIYDVLKQKHSNVIKSDKQAQEEVNISKERFMKFTPIQILGLIELKGGISFFRNSKGGNDIFQQIKHNSIPIKTFFNLSSSSKEKYSKSPTTVVSN